MGTSSGAYELNHQCASIPAPERVPMVYYLVNTWVHMFYYNSNTYVPMNARMWTYFSGSFGRLRKHAQSCARVCKCAFLIAKGDINYCYQRTNQRPNAF